jgi:hypothetical protein
MRMPIKVNPVLEPFNVSEKVLSEIAAWAWRFLWRPVIVYGQSDTPLSHKPIKRRSGSGSDSFVQKGTDEKTNKNSMLKEANVETWTKSRCIMRTLCDPAEHCFSLAANLWMNWTEVFMYKTREAHVTSVYLLMKGCAVRSVQCACGCLCQTSPHHKFCCNLHTL